MPHSLGPPWTPGAAQSLLSRELAVSWITREHSPHSDHVITQSLESLSSPAHSSLQAAETTGTKNFPNIFTGLKITLLCTFAHLVESCCHQSKLVELYSFMDALHCDAMTLLFVLKMNLWVTDCKYSAMVRACLLPL